MLSRLPARARDPEPGADRAPRRSGAPDALNPVHARWALRSSSDVVRGGRGGAAAAASAGAGANGQPLPRALGDDLGARFGYDFSDVRIHTGGPAAQAARSVAARAYTLGRDVVFGAGQDWRINSSTAALDAFITMGQDPYFTP